MALFSKQHYLALAHFCGKEIAAKPGLTWKSLARELTLHLAWRLRDDNPAFDLPLFMSNVEDAINEPEA